MKYSMRMIHIAGLTLLLSSCGSNEPKTLASLEYKPEQELAVKEEQEVQVKSITHEELRQEYKELIELFEEDELKEKIERRIADVHMMEGVYEHNKGKPKESYYTEATQAYQEILKKYPNSPNNAEVLYQLSKAYDIEAKQEESLATLLHLTRDYPNYANIPEAYFRKGDIHFSNQQYRDAKQSYQAVIASGNKKLNLNAHYMLGWSNYKLLDYYQSIDSFSHVLNELLEGRSSVEGLNKREKPLANDSISSVSLAFDKVGGAKEIAATKALEDKSYIWMIYDNLGQYYLSKELYEESASTFRFYVNNHSDSDKAPDLHVKLVDTYVQGGFARQSLIEKEHYITAYGLGSDYYRNRDGMSPSIKQTLNIYLNELAAHFHSLGQLHQKSIATIGEKKVQSSKDQEKTIALYTESVASFNKAAAFYEQLVNTFPNAEDVDKTYFLKAEALYSAYEYPKAIMDYERVAYNPAGVSALDDAVSAGYAAIISYEKYLEVLRTGFTFPGKPLQALVAEDSQQIKDWKQQAVDSMLAFAGNFPTDERSPSVLNNAAEHLFALEQYEKTIDVSTALLNNESQGIPDELRKTAYGLIANSHFKLNRFAKAEQYYIQQRQLADKQSEEYQQISERLAVATYKEAELMIAREESAAAIDQLLKVKVYTPNSPVRVTAQYDAAVLLLKAERWGESINELKELKTLYPEHDLAVEFPRQLAFAYEKSEDWTNAGNAYIVLVNDDPDPAIRQEALFVAANMYEKDLDYAKANQYFKRYVETYSQPFDNYLEALYHLAVNNETLGKQQEQNTWLTELINVDQKTERSRWLAAWANAKYGDYYGSLFAGESLSQPIVDSIQNKNKWLQQASASYQAAADYGILEFVTMASYKVGVLYRQFAYELREVPTPEGLSESDQQIYVSIIEEQAAPFDQLAIDLQQANVDRAWSGQFNNWISKSYAEMKNLSPKRFNKAELIVSYGNGIY